MRRWWVYAACAGTNENIWYSNSAKVQKWLIRAYCDQCPVQQECLEAELKIESKLENQGLGIVGVFGGLTANERKVMIASNIQESMEFNQDHSAIAEVDFPVVTA